MKNKYSFLFFVAIITLVACQTKQTESETDQIAPKLVKVVEAKEEIHHDVVIASGRLSSKEEIKLSFKTGGIIKEIRVSEGQKVRKGALLAILNLEEIQAQTPTGQTGKAASSNYG